MGHCTIRHQKQKSRWTSSVKVRPGLEFPRKIFSFGKLSWNNREQVWKDSITLTLVHTRKVWQFLFCFCVCFVLFLSYITHLCRRLYIVCFVLLIFRKVQRRPSLTLTPLASGRKLLEADVALSLNRLGDSHLYRPINNPKRFFSSVASTEVSSGHSNTWRSGLFFDTS